MGKYRIILVDADVVSHFLVAGRINELSVILAPNLVFIVDNVYNEAIRHPSDPDRKTKVDTWIKECKITRIPFPFANEKVRMEFYRIKKDYPMLDEGERACMAMSRYCKEVIASSNFNDIKQYAEDNGIEYIGCIDILYVAWKNGLFSSVDCNNFINTALTINHARFPVFRIEDYQPDRDLSLFLH